MKTPPNFSNKETGFLRLPAIVGPSGLIPVVDRRGGVELKLGATLSP